MKILACVAKKQFTRASFYAKILKVIERTNYKEY